MPQGWQHVPQYSDVARANDRHYAQLPPSLGCITLPAFVQHAQYTDYHGHVCWRLAPAWKSNVQLLWR